jgi:hypothetical protein
VKSRTHGRFWDRFDKLPADIQALACEKFQIWKRDAFHPSLHFKPVIANVWSARVGDHYRALARRHGDLAVWFWIGTHEDYNNFIRQLR